jgi:CPA2 family monovalent cation:H+ antiporter-2
LAPSARARSASALLLGLVAVRLKLPALVGYLVTGVAIGLAAPGFVADIEIAAQLSETSVMLLMVGVGLQVSLQDLLSVRRLGLPGAVMQMLAATAMGAAVALWWGWPARWRWPWRLKTRA